MATYLVTGGAGFIGSHLADRLIGDGHRVVILDNESTGRRENVPAEALYLRGDVTNPADVRRAFRTQLDGVLHVAGQASTIRSFDEPGQDLRVNAVGTLNILQACLEHRVPRLLFASSMTVYGHPGRVPTPETEPCRPVSYYGVAKYAAERYAMATMARRDLDFCFAVTAFRMFNVYGERQRLDNPYQGVVGIFIGNLLRAEPITIFGDGQQSRDFVHIDDVVTAWCLALPAEAAAGQVFNLGMGERRSINTLVDTALAALGRSRQTYPVRYGPERPGDQRHMQADVSRLRQVLGWAPAVDFATGMRRTVQWAQAQVAVERP